MAGFSRYLQRELLDHVLKTGAYVQPTNVYVALFTAGPTECVGTGGGRSRRCRPIRRYAHAKGSGAL